jgi:general secretion pathway protein J
MCTRPSPQQGFTLLELLVAVTLMAIVALLGWRGLDAVIAARDDITRNTDRLRALSLALGQIEDDLRAAWYARLVVSREPVIVLREVEPGLFALEMLRLAPSAAGRYEPDRSSRPADPMLETRLQVVQRVVWRVSQGRLERGAAFAPIGGAATPELSDSATRDDRPVGLGWVWQPVLQGVDAASWRIWIEGSGWLPQSPPTLAAAATPKSDGSAAMPAVPGGIELSLAVGGERLVRILAARD